MSAKEVTTQNFERARKEGAKKKQFDAKKKNSSEIAKAEAHSQNAIEQAQFSFAADGRARLDMTLGDVIKSLG